MKSQFDNYMIKDRSEMAITKFGSIESAISNIRDELAKCNSLWSKYSSDCLSHAITCNRMMIDYLTALAQSKD